MKFQPGSIDDYNTRTPCDTCDDQHGSCRGSDGKTGKRHKKKMKSSWPEISKDEIMMNARKR